MFNRSMSSHLPTPPLSCLYVNLKGTSNIFVPVRLQKSILPVFFSFLSFFFFFFCDRKDVCIENDDSPRVYEWI